MFETRFPQHLTRFAAELETLQADYADCWTGLERSFTGERRRAAPDTPVIPEAEPRT